MKLKYPKNYKIKAPPTKEEDKLTDEELKKWLNTKGHIPNALRRQVIEAKRKPLIEESQKIRAVRKQKRGDTQKIVQRQKLDLFLEEFLKNGGNATRAALRVFNCKSLSSAAVVGSLYLQKGRASGRLHLEKKGYGYGKLLDVATKKMEESKNPEWWDRIMKIAKYEDFLEKKNTGAPVAVNVFQAHKSFVSDYIEDAEIVKDEISLDDMEAVEEAEDED